MGDKCSLHGSKNTKQKINGFHSGTTHESTIRLCIDHRKYITNVLLTWCGWQLVELTLSRRVKAIGYVMLPEFFEDKVKSCQVSDENVLNTSDHYPVEGTYHFPWRSFHAK